MENRYFLVSYFYKINDCSYGIGDISFKHKGNKFPNNNLIRFLVKENNGNIDQPTIISIFEFKNSKDFNNYSKKE
jgi:hypothetical protein